jgi:hypothetical protein
MRSSSAPTCPMGVAIIDLDGPARQRLARVLRHRHAGDAGQARPRRRGVSSRERQIAAFRRYFSFSGGEVLTGSSETSARAALRALLLRGRGALPNTLEPFERWDLGYLGTYSADRQPALERLLIEPARRPAASALRRRRAAISRHDRLACECRAHRASPAFRTTPSFYSRQRFTLNVTRADMVAAGWSPSVRLFEAAACGTPIISDRLARPDELLPEGEAIVHRARARSDVIEALTDR